MGGYCSDDSRTTLPRFQAHLSINFYTIVKSTLMLNATIGTSGDANFKIDWSYKIPGAYHIV